MQQILTTRDKYVAVYPHGDLQQLLHIDKRGRIWEHRMVVEITDHCCLLPWSIVHHKNGDTTDNRRENLEPMMRIKHLGVHRKGKRMSWLPRIPDDRQCFVCGTMETLREKHGERINRYAHWRKFDGQYYCNKCACKKRREIRKHEK